MLWLDIKRLSLTTFLKSLCGQLTVWFLLLSLVPLLMVSVIAYQQVSSSMIEAAERDLEKTAREKVRFISNWFGYRRADLLQLAKNPETRAFVHDLQAGYQTSGETLSSYIRSDGWKELTQRRDGYLQRYLHGYDYAYDAFLIDRDGNILFTLAQESDLGTNIVDGPYSKSRFAQTVKATLQNRRINFSDFERFEPTGPSISGFIAAPVYSESGQLIAVVAVQLKVDRITELLKNNQGSPEVHYLVGKDGLLRTPILGTPSEVLRRTISTKGFYEWQKEHNHRPQIDESDTLHVHNYQYLGMQGRKVMGIYHDVDLWNIRWALVSEVDYDYALSDVRRLTRFIGLIGLLTVCVVIVCAVAAARRISRPLLNIVMAADQFAEGKSSQPVSVKGVTEIVWLAKAFNRMLLNRQRYEQDITNSHLEARKALSELADQRFALDQHAIVAITDVKGDITYVNQKFIEISGYQKEELIGHNHRLLNSGAHDTSFFRDLYRTIGQGKVWQGEICNRAKDGRLYWVDTTIVPFMGENGKPAHYIAIRADVTSRKQFEADLLQAKEEAIAAGQAKGRFLASMSHEIRTPMNGVLGMLGLLDRSQLNDEQKHFIALAKGSAESLLSLINDILDFSKIEANKLDIEQLDFHLSQMLGDFIDSMALRAQDKGIELILDLSSISNVMVKGDPGRLRQILTNLVGNAIKFTHEGEVVVSARLDDESGNYRLVCQVTDTGIGIEEQKLAAIFDVFTQVDASTTRQFGGTGLGLAIVKRLCDLMNGEVSAKSVAGKGSCFSFSVLLEKSDKFSSELPEVELSGVPMLIVDDNRTNREVLHRQLAGWGADVTEASDGREAIRVIEKGLVEQGKEPFSVAFLDFQMPGMDGASLGQFIRQNPELDNMKLVLMTSMASRGDARHFAELGFNAYFPKPTTTQDLYDALAVVLAGGEVMEKALPLVTSHYVRSLNQRSSIPIHDAAEDEICWPENTRVLIVEDNYVNQVVVQSLLEDMRIISDIAGDGVEALAALEKSLQSGRPYNLVLMDCQMPEMDGYEATRQIRKGEVGDEFKDITIVALTANAMAGDQDKCLAAGMTTYLTKPIDGDALLKVLKQYILGERSETPLSENVTIVNEDVEMGDQHENTISVWDREKTLARIKGREALLKKLVALFVSDLPAQVEQLHGALTSGDQETSVLAAHTIKGMAGNIGAEELTELAAQMEQACRQGDLKKGNEDWAVFVNAVARIQSRLSDEYL